MLCAMSVQLLAVVCLHILCLCLCVIIYLCAIVPPFPVIRSALAPQSDSSFSVHSCALSVGSTGKVGLHLIFLYHSTERSENQFNFVKQTHAFIGLASLCITVRILYEIQVFQVMIPYNLVCLMKGWEEYGASIFMVGITQVLTRFVRNTNFVTCRYNLLFAVICTNST